MAENLEKFNAMERIVFLNQTKSKEFTTLREIIGRKDVIINTAQEENRTMKKEIDKLKAKVQKLEEVKKENESLKSLNSEMRISLEEEINKKKLLLIFSRCIITLRRYDVY